jgi:thymidylate synthase
MADDGSSAAAQTFDDLMRIAVGMVLSSGAGNAASRGGNLEVIGARLELSNPRSRLSRTETRRKAVSAIAELCWYLRGVNDVEPVSFWIKKYDDEAEEDGTVHGGYGPRLFGPGQDAQVEQMVKLLSDPERSGTRRAVIQLFDRADIATETPFNDVPCTCTMQFLRRDERLNMVVYMRSNDVYKGFTHDVFCFTMLQEIVAREIGVEVGRYIHLAGSLHLYDEDLAGAKRFLAEGWQSTTDPMPSMPAGTQTDHVRALLQAEEQLRRGALYSDLQLPSDPYWADLVRVLALFMARNRRHDEDEAQLVIDAFVNQAFSEFV